MPRCVLVLRFSALGDVAMTIPVLYPVCRANPDTQFVMLTKPWPAGVFHDRPDNLVVVDADVDKTYKGVKGLWRLTQQVRSHYHVDAVADLHSVLRSWVIDACMRLNGVKSCRIDKERSRRRALVNHKGDKPLTSTLERYRRVFINLGLQVPQADSFTRLYDGRELPVSAIVPPKEAGQRWIAVSPFSAHRGKVYPMQLMSQVIDGLSQLPQVSIFMLGGGKDEKVALRPLAKQYHNVVSMAEVKHGFTDEYALLGRCDVMLTMDSANMHLASLMGLPAVTIWGATHPKCGFKGYEQSDDNDIQLDLPCRPCCIYGERDCRLGDYRCLTGIDPQSIVEKINNLLNKNHHE